VKRIFIISLLFLLSFRAGVHGESMNAASTTPGPGLRVILTWPQVPGITRFNLYRKAAGAPAFPATPLNQTPLGVYTTCSEIRAVMPFNSAAWKSLANGLAENPIQPFDPCTISTTVTNAQFARRFGERLQVLAQAQWQIAVVLGQGYIDSAVTSGINYTYQLRGVDASGANISVGNIAPVTITAGAPSAIPAPTGLTASAGDSRVLLLWPDETAAAGYVVLRATAPAGPYQQVNVSTFSARFTTNAIAGVAVNPPMSGFLDMMRWDLQGAPTNHLVDNQAVWGPSNGTLYYYKVVSTDLLGRRGPEPAVSVSATPVDTTPPVVPVGVKATAVDAQKAIAVSWTYVPYDAAGHLDSSGVSSYQLFRFNSNNASPTSGQPIGHPVPVPTNPIPITSATVISAYDHSSDLLPLYGETNFWYRVQARDKAGNVSDLSSAVSAHLKDTTPPAPPQDVKAVGFDDYIEITWRPNTEPDLDGYDVYRTLCDRGVVNPCNPGVTNPKPNPTYSSGPDVPDQPCTGEYALIAEVSLNHTNASGKPYFDDHTIPAGSPLCYNYWIRAFDQSQNKSGGQTSNPNIPGTNDDTVCQRLRDTTPPGPAIITGLLSRSNAVEVSWIGPPVQNIYGYHVYRSDQENGTYQWVGGETVGIPPAPPQAMTQPYHPAGPVGCDTIPITVIDAMSMGTFVDQAVVAHQIYWYKVVGVNQDGLETPTDKAIARSTFSYTTELPATPAITSIAGTSTTPLGLDISWSPPFDANSIKGFVLFRCDTQDGLYRQIGTLLQTNQYTDTLVVKGQTYWYKLVQMDNLGHLSRAPNFVSGQLGP